MIKAFRVVMLVILVILTVQTLPIKIIAATGTIGDTVVCIWKDNRNGAYTPTYDDVPAKGTKSLFNVFEPLQEEYRIKASEAIISDPLSYQEGYTWDMIKGLFDKGWVYPSNHTETHEYDLGELPVDSKNLNQTIEKINNQFLNCNSSILNKIGYKIESAIYPSGSYNDIVTARAEDFFVVSRTCDPRPYSDPSIDPCNPNSDKFPFDPEHPERSALNLYNTQDYQKIKTWYLGSRYLDTHHNKFIDSAITYNGWSVTLAHGVIGEDEGYDENLLWPEEWFENAYAYAKTKIDAELLWNDNLDNVGKYLRERQTSNISIVFADNNKIEIHLTAITDTQYVSYNFPLTLKTIVPNDWTTANINQGSNNTLVDVVDDNGIKYIYYDAIPNKENIVITPSTDTIVTFKDKSATSTPLTGMYRGIQWDSSAWYTMGNFGSKCLYYNEPNKNEVEMTFTLPTGKVLKSMDLCTSYGSNSIVKVSSVGNPERIWEVPAHATGWTKFYTNWLNEATTVTVKITSITKGAYDVGIDNIIYGYPFLPLGKNDGYTNNNIYPIIAGDWNGEGKSDFARVGNDGVYFYTSSGIGWNGYPSLPLGKNNGNGFPDNNNYPIITGDWNGDGKTDFARVGNDGIYFKVSTGSGWQEADYPSLPLGKNDGYTDNNIYPIITGDWNGDGKTDFARVGNDGVYFYTSSGIGWNGYPSLPLGENNGNGFPDNNNYPIITGDWNGDGKTDFARIGNDGVFFYISTGTGWIHILDF